MNVDPAAMRESLGEATSPAEANALHRQMASLAGRSILFVGDSQLRNQFMQLARIGLELPRAVPFAAAFVQHKHTGLFETPYPLNRPEKPDSSNGYWGGFPWLIMTAFPYNLTVTYAKIWGCADFMGTLGRASQALRRHGRRRSLSVWPPDTVVWNFGLHLLHIYPARPVSTVAVRCGLDYEGLLTSSFRQLRSALPSARLVWRTTNAVCEGRFTSEWSAAVRAYHCIGSECNTRSSMRISEMCRRRYNMSTDECRNSFMDERNTRVQRSRSLSLFGPGGALTRDGAPVAFLDAFALTERSCNETADGRHYPLRLKIVNKALLSHLHGVSDSY